MDMRKYFGKGDISLHMKMFEQYLSAPQEGYVAPPIPVEINDYSELKHNPPKFGHECKKFYYHSEDLTYLNHGGYGFTLKDSLIVSQAFQTHIDQNPYNGMEREVMPILSHVTRVMADFIHCEARDLVLIETATYGINSVLKSLKLAPEDTIVTLSTAYGTVGIVVDYMCELSGAKHKRIPITLPIASAQQVLDMIKADLHGSIKLAIFSHLPPGACFLLPIKELIDTCRERGILSMIDGAHALGQIDIDIKSLDPDIYLASAHKWLGNPKGSALMYVRRQLQDKIKPLTISLGHKFGFAAEFADAATRCYTPYFALLNTINFWKALGEERIREYCSSTVRQAEKMCREAWNVEPVCPEELISCMAAVLLPKELNDPNWKVEDEQSYTKQCMIADYLYHEHKIEVIIKSIDGFLYVRLCCFIYNELSDFQKLIEAVQKACNNRDKLVNYTAVFDS